jgi:hypothetical protein
MHIFDGFIVIATHVTTPGRLFVASPTVLYVGAMLRSTLIVKGGTRRRPNSSLQSHFWCFVWEMHNFDGFIGNATRVTTLCRDFVASPTILYVGALMRSTLIVNRGTRRRPNSSF